MNLSKQKYPFPAWNSLLFNYFHFVLMFFPISSVIFYVWKSFLISFNSQTYTPKLPNETTSVCKYMNDSTLFLSFFSIFILLLKKWETKEKSKLWWHVYKSLLKSLTTFNFNPLNIVLLFLIYFIII